MQRSLQASLVIIALLLGCIVFGLFSRSARSQSSVPSPAATGRYQLLVPSDNAQYIIDTQTGRVWYRLGTGVKSTWDEQGPDYTKAPVVAKP